LGGWGGELCHHGHHYQDCATNFVEDPVGAVHTDPTEGALFVHLLGTATAEK